MFEKEAEEYAFDEVNHRQEWYIKHPEHSIDWDYEDIKKHWGKGAEFGYNKANKWKYPSNGELPECDEKTQLIFYVNYYYEIDGETKIRKRTVLGFYKKSFMNDDVKLFVEKSKGYEEEHLPKDVIAWKEIVLPELKESK